ncbi:ABC transporter ATP-binding protein [Marinomonas sp. THO17]|uniref:ABC transporter ATP-binding protein n=1 Tax=Marinomonas sp. THO17 TaxID=3149048 RepID=UPI00336C1D7F
MSSEHIIHIEDVYKGYDGKVILKDIDLKIQEGEFCSVVGPSGCGKSTLLRLLLGQELPDSGSILFDGKPVIGPEPSRGVVYQKYSLFPHLTVLENVMLGPKYLGINGKKANKAEMVERAMYFLKRVRLDNAADKYPDQLSGGMQQRVAITQTLIAEPKLLLMDEPFGALDPDTREELQVFLLELWESLKLTVLFVTHSLEEACFVGTRLIALSQYNSYSSAKIVEDHLLDKEVKSTTKDDLKFIELITQVRKNAFDPDILQHLEEFNLKHPDSFMTP